MFRFFIASRLASGRDLFFEIACILSNEKIYRVACNLQFILTDIAGKSWTTHPAIFNRSFRPCFHLEKEVRMKTKAISLNHLFALLVLIIIGFMNMGFTSVRIIIEQPTPGPVVYKTSKNTPPPWAPAHGYRAKNQYRYYPCSQVYYEPARQRYFYFSNGQWRVSMSLPVASRPRQQHYVTLNMDTDRPYRYHSHLVQTYPYEPKKNMNKGRDNSRGKGRGG
jgi:hypothetical protein